jgi:hypothetical protein
MHLQQGLLCCCAGRLLLVQTSCSCGWFCNTTYKGHQVHLLVQLLVQPVATQLRLSDSAHVMHSRASPLWQLLRSVCAGALIKDIIKIFVKLQLQNNRGPINSILACGSAGGSAGVCLVVHQRCNSSFNCINCMAVPDDDKPLETRQLQQNTPAGRQAKAPAALHSHLPASGLQQENVHVHTRGSPKALFQAGPTYIPPAAPGRAY